MTKQKGDEICEIKKYKGPHTCVSSVINKVYRQLDVLDIPTMIKTLVRAEVSISVSIIQAVVGQSSRAPTRRHVEKNKGR